MSSVSCVLGMCYFSLKPSYIQSPFALTSSSSSLSSSSSSSSSSYEMYVHTIPSKRKFQKQLNELFRGGYLTFCSILYSKCLSLRNKKCPHVVVLLLLFYSDTGNEGISYVTAQSLNILLMFGWQSGSEIALSWSPMRLKILHWRPEFHSWSPAGD